jgi:hypothetical protein
VFLAGWAFFTLTCVWRIFPETTKRNKFSNPHESKWNGITQCFGHRHFLGFAGMAAFTQAAIITMLSLEGFVLTNYYSMSQADSGVLIGIIPVAAVFLASLITPYIATMPIEKTLQQGG